MNRCKDWTEKAAKVQNMFLKDVLENYCSIALLKLQKSGSLGAKYKEKRGDSRLLHCI